MIKTADEVNQKVYKYFISGNSIENLTKIIEAINPEHWSMEILDDECDDYGATYGEVVDKIEDIPEAYKKVDPTLITISGIKDGKEFYVPFRLTQDDELIVHTSGAFKEFFEAIADEDWS